VAEPVSNSQPPGWTNKPDSNQQHDGGTSHCCRDNRVALEHGRIVQTDRSTTGGRGSDGRRGMQVRLPAEVDRQEEILQIPGVLRRVIPEHRLLRTPSVHSSNSSPLASLVRRRPGGLGSGTAAHFDVQAHGRQTSARWLNSSKGPPPQIVHPNWKIWLESPVRRPSRGGFHTSVPFGSHPDPGGNKCGGSAIEPAIDVGDTFRVTRARPTRLLLWPSHRLSPKTFPSRGSFSESARP
jgi:hypothetical protein